MITISHAEIDTKDSSYRWFDTQRAAVCHADPEATLSIRQGLTAVVINVTPSNQIFRQDIINSLLAANKLIGQKIIFSKSLAISKSISFSINL